MKLKKIKKIKVYKSFQDFSWQPFLNNETFHDEVNIIYGENGSGKSSIANLLKNVSENKDFGKYKPIEACLVFDDGEKKYPVNNDWDNKIPKGSILFFDHEFVDKNVHMGSRRDTTQNGQEQESGKMIIEFDSNAINLRGVRDVAKKAKEEQDQKIKDFNSANKDYLFNILTDDEKLYYQNYKDNTEDEIKKVKQDLEKEKREAGKNFEIDQGLQKKVTSIQSGIKSLPTEEVEISLSDIETYQKIFDFDLKERASIKAEQDLIDKVKTHKIFFETGFEIRKTHQNRCPFCQSENEEAGIKKIVDLFKQIYDTTYKTQAQQFEKDKQTLLGEISQITKSVSDFDLNNIFLELKKLDQNYKIPYIYSVEDEEIYKKPAVKEIKDLSDKISKLTKPDKENIKDLYTKVKTEFKVIEAFFKAIGDFVEQRNNLIVKFKSDNTDEKLQARIATSSKRIAEVEKVLVFINGNKIKEQQKKVQKEKELKVMQDVLATLKIEYETALKNYEEHCSTKAFSNLLSKIQDYFKNFNFSFKLKLKTDPTGNKTEFPFAFKVLDFEGNERDFNEGLSEGEIQVLSLCFFFAFLDIQKEKDQKILIFDDPITSLDSSNLSYLVDLISEEQNNFSQIFVFTHHRTFFKFLRKRFGQQKIGCKEFNVIRNRKELGGSFLCKSHQTDFMPLLRNFESDLRSWSPLDIELKIVEYGQYLRYEVEKFIKNELLHINETKFEDIVDGVKNNQNINVIDLEKIKEIYLFCNWTTSHVDVGDDHGLDQLKTKIIDFVSIIN
ncbi:MAG: AAA family ATPase [Microgenomates group bacterium]